MKPLHGLIVEDDPMVEFIHRNYLEKIGRFQEIYSADAVTDAEYLLQNKQVDLVLLDVHLKNGNGLDLLKEIRNSHVSVRKYMLYLEKNNYVTSQIIYTKIGRPYKVYQRS